MAANTWSLPAAKSRGLELPPTTTTSTTCLALASAGTAPQPTFITPHNEGPNLNSLLSQVQERSCSPAAWPTNADPGSIWVARFLAGSAVAVVTGEGDEAAVVGLR